LWPGSTVRAAYTTNASEERNRESGGENFIRMDEHYTRLLLDSAGAETVAA
jgi:putative NADPH-quinone reductase